MNTAQKAVGSILILFCLSCANSRVAEPLPTEDELYNYFSIKLSMELAQKPFMFAQDGPGQQEVLGCTKLKPSKKQDACLVQVAAVSKAKLNLEYARSDQRLVENKFIIQQEETYKDRIKNGMHDWKPNKVISDLVLYEDLARSSHIHNQAIDLVSDQMERRRKSEQFRRERQQADIEAWTSISNSLNNMNQSLEINRLKNRQQSQELEIQRMRNGGRPTVNPR